MVEPPDITYRLLLSQEMMNKCKLSAPQLETVVYASQKQQTFMANGERHGFFLGDGAGVGKGRQLSGGDRVIVDGFLVLLVHSL